MKANHASVIIIVKNDLGVEHTLGLLERQKGVAKFETIVIDASSPETLAEIRNKFPTVKWVPFNQRGRRFTIPEQRNLGMKLATGDVLFFIDASCRPKTNWMSKMLEDYARGENIVCGPCLPSNPVNLVPHAVKHSKRTYVDECATRNVMLSRTVVNKVGGFDTTMQYGEDVDFFWRARQLGFKICYDPATCVTHDYGDLREQFQRAYRYGKGRIRLYLKHRTTHLTSMLKTEPHVWIYPLYILGLPLTIILPFYPLLILLLIIKNRSVSIVAHHLVFGLGVIAGLLRPNW
jgi:glycosyltransferase involved in cell wall biosynthesis